MKIVSAAEAAALLRPTDSLAVPLGPVSRRPSSTRWASATTGRRSTCSGRCWSTSSRSSPARACAALGLLRARRARAAATPATTSTSCRRTSAASRRLARAMAPRVMAHRGRAAGRRRQLLALAPRGRDGRRAAPLRARPRAAADRRGEPQPAAHARAAARVTATRSTSDDSRPRRRERRGPSSRCPTRQPTEIERRIAAHARTFIPDGCTLQTGIGGVPDQIARMLAEEPGGDYGIHRRCSPTG